MPNWCENEIDIAGPREDLIKFLQDVGFYETPETFSFNRIIPMPEELKNIHTGYADIVNVSSKHWTEDAAGNKFPLSQEDIDNLLDRCGATDWYGWCNKYWGTKWDASEVEYYSNDPKDSTNEDAYMSLRLETAWGPPEEFYNVIVHKYPTLSFTWFYKEPGMQIAGWLGA